MNSEDRVERVLAALRADRKTVERKSPDRYMAQCPAHLDGEPSLQITRGHEGRALLHCFAGCATEDVVAALGLSFADLFPDGDKKHEESKTYAPRTIADTYDYRDEQGKLLYQVVRYEPKGFTQRRPDGRGGWVDHLADTRRVLYRLPELIAAPADRRVFVVEGEKDVHTLEAHGFLATTNMGGGGNWKPEHGYSQALTGRHVILLPDNDDTGRRHERVVCASLHSCAIASLRVVRLPDLAYKEDVTDWFAKGNTADQLKEIVRTTPPYAPESHSDGSPDTMGYVDTGQGENGPDLALQNAGGEVTPPPKRWEFVAFPDLVKVTEEVEWLVDGYIARRYMTILTAFWKSGKSQLLAHLLAALSGMGGEFAGLRIMPANVLVVSEEDESHWIKRRDELGIEAGAKLLSQPFRGRPATKKDWLAFLDYVHERVLLEDTGLVVIDSLHNLWSVKNENDNAEVKAWLEPFVPIQRAGAAVLLLAHPSKPSAGHSKELEGFTRGGGATEAFADILIQMRRYEVEDVEDTRRVLTGLGRFMDVTPHEMVVEYLGAAGYRNVGTKHQTRSEELKATLRSLLPATPPGETLEWLAKAWGERERDKPPKREIAYELDYMARSGGEVLRLGTGTSGSPFRYSRAEGNLQWQGQGQRSGVA